MKTKYLLYIAVSVCYSLQGAAQQSKISKAEKQYDNYAYVDAIAIYERVAEKGYKDEKLLQNLANAYYFKAELPKAVKWYDELFALNAEQEPEYYYRYAQSLKSIGNYTKADEMLGKFSEKLKDDTRSKLYLNQKNYLEIIKANSGRYETADAGVNSEFSDFGSTIIDSKLVFASARDTSGIAKAVFKWTNESFTNLYSAELQPDEQPKKPERFSNSVNTKFHESTPAFTKDGTTMYFTRNNYLNGKRRNDSRKVTLLKIYKATLKDGKWADVKELSFNSNEYSVAHPALSPDEKTLYFSSDMPGTVGKSDIFKVDVNQDGSFGTPQNLGSAINTNGRETFPFISGDNELYFSSDGHPGLGGLDIFVAQGAVDNSFSNIQNVGEPLNSPQDDFGFFMKSDSRAGFFTSNREGGKGYDDIYTYTELRKLTSEQSITGVLSDQTTGQPLAGVKVSLLSNDFKTITSVTTDANGYYSFVAPSDNNYYIKAESEDYQTKEDKVVIGGGWKIRAFNDLRKEIKENRANHRSGQGI